MVESWAVGTDLCGEAGHDGVVDLINLGISASQNGSSLNEGGMQQLLWIGAKNCGEELVQRVCGGGNSVGDANDILPKATEHRKAALPKPLQVLRKLALPLHIRA